MDRKLILSTLQLLKETLDKDYSHEFGEGLTYLYSESVKTLTSELADKEERFHIFEITKPEEILDILYDLEATDKVISVIPTGFGINIIVENTKSDLGFSKRQIKNLTPLQKLELANKNPRFESLPYTIDAKDQRVKN